MSILGNTKRWKRTAWDRIKSVNSRLESRKCRQCKKDFRRTFYGIKFQCVRGRYYPYEHWETLERYFSRKYCSASCKKIAQKGTGNPNYKGLMPKCLDCGARLNSYAFKNRPAAKRCRTCFLRWAKKTRYFQNTSQLKLLVERSKKTKGIYPINLKPYKFQKGQKSFRRLYEDYMQCKEDNCVAKPIARMMCAMHYRRWQKKLSTEALARQK